MKRSEPGKTTDAIEREIERALRPGEFIRGGECISFVIALDLVADEIESKEWLLDLDFHRRETFGYSCEAVSQVVSRSKTLAGRRALGEQYARQRRITGGRVEPSEVADTVEEAAAARNGWKVIHARCAP